jgi:hypothetical protein
MTVEIKEISKEKLEKNGWEYLPLRKAYCKTFTHCNVFVELLGNVWPRMASISCYEIVTPDDLIAISQELKKLEAE